MPYLGANIYYWGEAEQRRLLLEGVRRWADEVRSCNLSDRLWYCRFDARGPHVFILLAAQENTLDGLRKCLDTRIRCFLLQSPSEKDLAQKELEQLHRECRGKTLCRADQQPDLAANNSFELFDHEPDGYPFWLSAGMAMAGEFWTRLDELVFWTFQYLEHGGVQAAIRWLAAVDQFLHRNALPAETYWRFHSSTLIPSLPQRLEGMTREEIQEMLQQVLSGKHKTSFSVIWDSSGDHAQHEFDMNGLMECVMANDGRGLNRCFQVLREVNHALLGQLGHRVDRQIPMVLYAWSRSLSVENLRSTTRA